jgi:hypothetical protein
MLPAHHTSSRPHSTVAHPFREPLQFIVIAVMSVISGAFPDTNGVFYVTINSWRIRGPSRHRHGERHRRNALPKGLTRPHDGDDAHDADIRAHSRQRVHLYFVGPYPFNLPDEPDAGSRKSYSCAVLEPIICVGFSQIG